MIGCGAARALISSPEFFQGQVFLSSYKVSGSVSVGTAPLCRQRPAGPSGVARRAPRPAL